jgi:flagellar hook-associated protein 1
MSTLSIGVSGLNAANIGLSTASHNIANASTPGYNRQVIVQGTNIAVMSGAGFIGQGTNVQTVKRVYDQFLAQQVLSAQAGASEMDSYLQQIQQIDNLLADSSSGLSPMLAEFFKGVQEAAANPSSIPARQSMLSAAQSLVARFQGLDQRLSEIRDGVNTQISGEVTLINSYATQIADINERILLARAGTTYQEPNDLLDQRDQLISDLNKSVKVSTLVQSDGSVNIFFGNGQPLVVGQQSYTLTAKASSSDPERIVVAMDVSPGNSIELPESQIVGGKLGGLVAFRSQSLDQAQSSLDDIAIALAQDFNDQHRLGMDLTGALGGDFFAGTGASDLRVALTDPRSIALAAPIRTAATLANSGTGSISAGEVLDVTNPNLQVTTTLNFVAGGYQINGAGPVIPYTSGANIDLNGWRVVISGTPAAGDVFTVERNTNGVSDSRNANALAALQTAKVMLGGTASYQSAYSQIVSAVGTKTREVQAIGEAQQSLADAAEAERQKVSGVNLDEEAANLLRYQQAYQAAARVIEISGKLFDELLAITN